MWILQNNEETNNAECIRCDSGFALNSRKICTNCWVGCEYCNIEKDSTPVSVLFAFLEHFHQMVPSVLFVQIIAKLVNMMKMKKLNVINVMMAIL